MNDISDLAYVHPEAQLGDGNIIGPFCYIDRNVAIGDNNHLWNSVTLHYGARIGSDNEFFPGASISTKPQDLKFHGEDSLCIIGSGNSIRENVTISRGTASKGKTVVGSNNLFMENLHIAHDCILGNHLIIGNSTKFGGEVTIDDNAVISAVVLCHQFCHIGGYVMLQGGTGFSKDIPPYIIAGRNPAQFMGINIVGLRRHNFTAEQIDIIHNAYRIIYRSGIIKDGLNEARMTYPESKEVTYICSFIENSQRGIIR